MLQGKTALVTGSTSGIGKGIAMVLAKSGANILLNGFANEQEIAALKQEFHEFGTKVDYHGANLQKPDEIEAMMAFAAQRFGRVDILVNNAGIQHVAPVEAFTPERWDAVIAINLSACFHTTRLAIPAMQQAGWGRIINIASVHGLIGSAHKSAYVAAKHGVVGLTKVVALETAKTGITVNAICPGWVLTPLVQKQIDDRAASSGITVEQAKINLLSEKQPSQDFVTPEQLGELTLFLCSPAGGQVRGVAWSVDGGWTAQ